MQGLKNTETTENASVHRMVSMWHDPTVFVVKVAECRVNDAIWIQDEPCNEESDCE